MLSKTEFFTSISKEEIQQGLCSLSRDDYRFTLNSPSANFLYDPWEIKDQYRDTVWHKILQSLPFSVGEARIIILESGQCYQSHADIDDRYHMNLTGSLCYAVNLETNQIFEMICDGYWYEFTADQRHSAANFGRDFRAQLVVRKLLIKNILENPVQIIFKSSLEIEATRFVGENIVSPWLNKANKSGMISNLQILDSGILSFSIEKDVLPKFNEIVPDGFSFTIVE